MSPKSCGQFSPLLEVLGVCRTGVNTLFKRTNSPSPPGNVIFPVSRMLLLSFPSPFGKISPYLHSFFCLTFQLPLFTLFYTFLSCFPLFVLPSFINSSKCQWRISPLGGWGGEGGTLEPSRT
jgi:hypothetical protein